MKKLVLVAVLWLSSTAYAGNYPLGTMTCDGIGQFASEAQGWRVAGKSRDDALAALETRTYGDPVEKKNLLMIVDLIFGSYGRNWSVETAGNILRNDCLKGR
ncbi:MAG: hypothetical protein ACKVP2_08735 [Burkholderiales bacterium]